MKSQSFDLLRGKVRNLEVSECTTYNGPKLVRYNVECNTESRIEANFGIAIVASERDSRVSPNLKWDITERVPSKFSGQTVNPTRGRASVKFRSLHVPVFPCIFF